MNGTYTKIGNYYIPNLLSTQKEQFSIGVWEQRHLRYIRQYKQLFYTNLLTSAKLNEYLADINRQAQSLFFELVENIAEKEGITEELKAENQMEWVSRINNIRDCAKEIVNHEIIYQ